MDSKRTLVHSYYSSFCSLATSKGHVLIDSATQTWNEEPIRSIFWAEDAEMSAGPHCLTAAEFELCLVTCWTIWWQRNQAKHGQILLDPLETATFSNHYLTYYRQLYVGY
ncbi:hypothetical protein Salat_1880000 [Sesamum alatum]|uniref:Uncharacterized protein n=1 Tax=Sesamum alatum TaxID=300844 RepID=A0AAE2CI88_9LAMI|nr:hypothetical protein Salat_1880000 [Sesamum alatum]